MVHAGQRLPIGVDGVIGDDAHDAGACLAPPLQLVGQLGRKYMGAHDDVRVVFPHQVGQLVGTQLVHELEYVLLVHFHPALQVFIDQAINIGRHLGIQRRAFVQRLRNKAVDVFVYVDGVGPGPHLLQARFDRHGGGGVPPPGGYGQDQCFHPFPPFALFLILFYPAHTARMKPAVVNRSHKQ